MASRISVSKRCEGRLWGCVSLDRPTAEAHSPPFRDRGELVRRPNCVPRLALGGLGCCVVALRLGYAGVVAAGMLGACDRCVGVVEVVTGD